MSQNSTKIQTVTFSVIASLMMIMFSTENYYVILLTTIIISLSFFVLYKSFEEDIISIEIKNRYRIYALKYIVIIPSLMYSFVNKTILISVLEFLLFDFTFTMFYEKKYVRKFKLSSMKLRDIKYINSMNATIGSLDSTNKALKLKLFFVHEGNEYVTYVSNRQKNKIKVNRFYKVYYKDGKDKCIIKKLEH